eukprot:gene9474-21250_t
MHCNNNCHQDRPNVHKRTAFKKATVRFLKIFVLGVITQCGISLIEFNMSKLRIMGILQRVAVLGIESAQGGNIRSGLKSIATLLRRYSYHWLVAALLLAVHSGIMYGVDVPPAFGFECGRGVLTPVCNAATYVDRHLFGVDHMYFPANGGDTTGNDMTFQRMPECSTCSPGKCWNHSDPTEGGGSEGGPEGGPVMPAWCNEAPFDPEGSVSTLNAILSTIIGCHFGHVFVQIKGHAARLYHMVIFSVVQVVLGLLLHFSNVIRMNTDLYSFSPFKYFGMNAITMFILAEGGIPDTFFSLFYLDNTNATAPPYDNDKNLQNVLWPTGVFWGDRFDGGLGRAEHPSHNPYVMVWAISYICFWMVLSWWMYTESIGLPTYAYCAIVGGALLFLVALGTSICCCKIRNTNRLLTFYDENDDVQLLDFTRIDGDNYEDDAQLLDVVRNDGDNDYEYNDEDDNYSQLLQRARNGKDRSSRINRHALPSGARHPAYE